MNSKQYYKVSAYIVGIMCIALIVLIFQSVLSQSKHSDQKNMTFAQELRAYRQVLYDLKGSGNPAISPELKARCANELNEVNTLIQAYEAGEEEEISLRTRFDFLATRLLSDPYLSITAKNGSPFVNANLEI
jgi:hypothetical protein